jgi:hypothetical protein
VRAAYSVLREEGGVQSRAASLAFLPPAEGHFLRSRSYSIVPTSDEATTGFAMDSERALSGYERERGKPMPSMLHSVVQTNLLGILLTYRPEY